MNVSRPLITEKTMQLAQKGWYTFAVAASARKEDIAKQVGSLYSVTVKDVRTVKKTGKLRKTGRKMIMKRNADWKKAMVKLAKGQKIAVFDIGEEAAKA